MGQSTDAILVYGVDLGEDPEDLPWNGDEDGIVDGFDDWLFQISGLVDPSVQEGWDRYGQLPEPRDYLKREEAFQKFEADNPEWVEARSRSYAVKREVVKACPIEIVTHCSGECPMVIVAVRGTKTRAWRGSPQVIDPASLAVEPAALSAAAEFCFEHGIPFEGPTWLLASDWN